MQDFILIAKALSDPSRVRILSALKTNELCVCRLVELLALAPSTVSKHISILRQAGLVVSRKSGRWVYYRRTAGSASPLAARTTAWFDDSLAGDPALSADVQHLRSLLQTPDQELCR